MASIDKRIADLERLIVVPEDEEAELRHALIHDILDEFASLRGCRARNSYRGGNPPTPIQPTDPVGDALGYPYTTGELVGFAVRRVFEREREIAPEILSEEDVEEMAANWTESMRGWGIGERWEEIEAEGPPEPTPPWH